MNDHDREAVEDEISRFEREREAPGERHYVKPRPPKDPAQVYSIRIPVNRLEQLRILADREGKRPTTMMREWVLERLDMELGRSPIHINDIPLQVSQVYSSQSFGKVLVEKTVVQHEMQPFGDMKTSLHVYIGSWDEWHGLDFGEEEVELPLPFSVAEHIRR